MYVAHVFHRVRTDFIIFFIIVISCIVFGKISEFKAIMYFCIEMYCYRQDENIEIPLNHLLLTVRY